jgi:hypothetical protein
METKETFIARCFSCDWGLTHEKDVVYQRAEEHSNECEGIVIVVSHTRPYRSHKIFLPRRKEVS